MNQVKQGFVEALERVADELETVVGKQELTNDPGEDVARIIG